MPRRVTCWALVLLAVASALVHAEGDKHLFTFDDWVALRAATPTAIAPDGKTILYRVDSGVAKGRTRHEWRTINADGTGTHALELPDDFTASGFTRDGSLYGAYEVNKVTQLGVVPIASGVAARTPSRVIVLPRGLHSVQISPDGARFAMLASPGDPNPLDEVRTVVEPERTSLYVVNVDGTNGAWWCPALTRIADGPIGGGALAWSRDSATVALVSQTPKIGFKDLVSTIDVCGPNGSRRAAEVPNTVSGVAWTDGGRTLAFLSTTTNVLTADHVWTVPAAGGAPVDRTPSLTGSATSLTGDAAGRVWVIVARGVQNEINRFENGALTTAYRWPAGSVVGLPVSSDIAGTPDQIAVGVGDPEHGTSVAVPSGNGLSRITTESDVVTARIDFGAVRVVKWTSKEAVALEGIATFPAGYHEGRRYPFLVLPHGGPEANDLLVLDAFSRIIAGLGYVVLQPQYPWVHRVRCRLPPGDLSALWRSRVPRRRQRHRLCRGPGMGRSGAAGHFRLERRRLHDVLDDHPDQSLSRGHRRGGHHGLGQLHVDERCTAVGLRRAVAREGPAGVRAVLRRGAGGTSLDAAAGAARRVGSARSSVSGTRAI